MTESRPPTSPTDDDLALMALRYAAGELSVADAETFGRRISEDQVARDALSEAIRLSAAALGQAPPTPDGLIRDAIRDRVWPSPITWLFPRRPYRGHPAAWAGLGGFTAAALTVFAVWLGDQPSPPYQLTPIPTKTPEIVERPTETEPSAFPSAPTIVVIHETEPGPTVIVEASESTLGTAIATNTPDGPTESSSLPLDSESTSEPKAAVPIESGSAAQ